MDMKQYGLIIAGVLAIALAAPAGADTLGGVDVDGAGIVGECTSLALDSSGHPHICYLNESTYDLRYASWNGTGWDIECVDSEGYAGWFNSLALDSSDFPHISYYDCVNESLKYASWNGTDWTKTIVDSDGNVGEFTSLALDSSGHPHISYHDHSNKTLKYASLNGTFWDIELVDSEGDVGRYTSLALDASDWPHISYYDGSNTGLKHASQNGTAWTKTLVDNWGDVGWDTSLALDASGYPHISYYDNTRDDLMYASYDGTNWYSDFVSDRIYGGRDTSLALDASGYPHISYYNRTNEALMYVSWDGTAWTTATVDSGGARDWVGDFSHASLALDSLDTPHISYYDPIHQGLKYARMWTAPVAGFTCSPVNGTAPLTVVCTDASTGQPDAWSWSFGDGGVSAEENPTHAYTTPGTYNVTLTVSNPDGSNSMTKRGYITVSPPPFSVHDIPLAAGWNMVSVPVTDAVVTTPPQMMDTVYGYDPANRIYAKVNVTALAPGRGYWVSATDACTLRVNGSYMDRYQADLRTGWNMIGSVSANASFTNPDTNPAGSVQNSLYGHRPALGTYVTTTTLAPGGGYWASATRDCILNVTV